MTGTQRRVFDDLLAVGADRPFSPDGLAAELRGILLSVTEPALERWTEPSLWLSKSTIATVLRCEGQVLAYAEAPAQSKMRSSTVAGIISHRAIQVAHTHPDQPVRSYVDWAVEAVCAEDPGVGVFWEEASPVTQSDVITQATERVTGFLDSWPVLQDRWEPRFESPIQAKVGKLTLAGRADLVLGRPRPPRQTMFLCDFKSGSLHEGHEFEASFYALLQTLRYEVAPFRSVVYSLASGEWTTPDVTADRLRQTAHTVAQAVSTYVDLLTGVREPALNPGPSCRWCPARETCPGAALAAELESLHPSTTTAPVSVVSGSERAASVTHSLPTSSAKPTADVPAEVSPPPSLSDDPDAEGPHGPFSL